MAAVRLQQQQGWACSHAHYTSKHIMTPTVMTYINASRHITSVCSWKNACIAYGRDVCEVLVTGFIDRLWITTNLTMQQFFLKFNSLECDSDGKNTSPLFNHMTPKKMMF